MSNKRQCLIKQGYRVGQIAAGRTITLSWLAKSDVLITMEPADKEEQCRLSQLRLAWLWASDAAKSGKGQYDIKEDCYWQFKVSHLAPVLAESDEKFAFLWDKLNALRALAGEETYRMMSDKAISHADCTVSQVSDALREWERCMLDQGIQLRQPSDYHFALQVESMQSMPESSRAA
ncbi:MAG: hypothetical protein KDI44_19440 [Thiothrix sp.]|nr:hypothetical protein [Thiothrix sp.]HPQ96079.1 hypothetical protein [Thiolinea sp.]